MGFLQQLLSQFKLSTGQDEDLPEKEKPEQLLEEVTFEGVANYIKKGRCEYNVALCLPSAWQVCSLPE